MAKALPLLCKRAAKVGLLERPHQTLTNMNTTTQSPTDAEATDVKAIDVEATAERYITEEYFRSFNQNQFEQTAALFGEEGALVPPFESPIIGQQAILAYLEKEAGNITAFPERWEVINEEGDIPQEEEGDTSQEWPYRRTQIIVTGKVNAIVFKVNVAWYFTITANDKLAPNQIERVRIKLLASPAELLGLKSD